MSFSHTNRETLLSAALDGELSVQEQLEFDQALATDPSFAQEFAELQSLRHDLKATLNRLREQSPAQDFANRIVAAAFELQTPSAVSVGRRGNASIPFGQMPERKRRTNRIAVSFALAASVLIALGIWNRDRLSEVFNQPAPQALAELKQPSQLQNNAPETVPALNHEDAARLDRELFASDVPSAEPLASVDNEPPKVMGIKPMPESVASMEPSVEMPVLGPNEVKSVPQADLKPLSLVLVLAVELTDQGREQLVLQDSLRATGIRLGEQSIVGSQVVAHLKDTQVISTNEDGKQAKLYFIEASTKQIDRLVTRLMTSPQAIASVGLSLAMDPPLLAAVGDLREIDPTTVRQDSPAGLARDIRAAGDAPISFDAKAFAPIDGSIAMSELLQTQPSPEATLPNAASPNAASSNAASSGDDSPSQLLLFVK